MAPPIQGDPTKEWHPFSFSRQWSSYHHMLYIYIYSTNLIKSFVESYSFDALGKLPFIFMLASSTWGATYTCKCSKLPFNNLTMHSQLSVPTTAYRCKDILISWSLWMKCLCTLGRKLMASSSWNVLFLYVAIGYFDI
jgi:hypothetical protein